MLLIKKQEILSAHKLLFDAPYKNRLYGQEAYEGRKIIKVVRDTTNNIRAHILDAEENTYTTLLYKDGTEFSCSCQEVNSCEHKVALAHWLIDTEASNLLNTSSLKKNKQGNKILVGVTNESSDWVALYLQDEDNYREAFHSEGQFLELKDEIFDLCKELIPPTFFDKNYNDPLPNFISSEIGSGEKPPLLISFETYINTFFIENKVPLYHTDGKKYYFGGFLDLKAILVQNEKITSQESYEFKFAFYDPFYKFYREVHFENKKVKKTKPDDLSYSALIQYFREYSYKILANKEQAIVLDERLFLTERKLSLSKEEEYIHNLFSKQETNNKIDLDIDLRQYKVFFTLYLPKKTFSILEHHLLTAKNINITELCEYQKSLETFIPKKIKKLVQNTKKYGPRIGLSIYPYEIDNTVQIKAKIELLYAEKEEYLDIEYWEKEKKVPSDKVFYSFPPNAKGLIRFSARKGVNFSYASKEKIIKRELKEEAKILEETNLPFRFNKNSGEFDFTRPLLRNFSQKYYAQLKKEKVFIRVHKTFSNIIKNKYSSSFQIENKSGTNWFAGSIKFHGISAEEQEKILQAYHKNQQMIKLNNGQWVFLSTFQLEKLYSKLDRLGIRIDQKGKSNNFSKGQLVALNTYFREEENKIKFTSNITSLLKNFTKTLAEETPSEFPLSKKLEKTLRLYQKEGCYFLFRLYSLKIGGILADEMGLGKTLQALAFLDTLHKKYSNKLYLVTGPLAALHVWETEGQKFVPDLPIQIWHASKRKGSEKLISKGLVVVTYAGLQKDIDIFTKKKFDIVFLDEAQNVKNLTSKSYKSIRKLTSQSFFCLTGTPIENHIGELWSLMEICFPGLLGSRKFFKKVYGSAQSLLKKRELSNRIMPFILRRRKEDVLKELPEKIENIIKLEFPPTQAFLYEKLRNDALDVLKEAKQDYLIQMLPYLTKLRRLCCHPNLENKENPDFSLSSKFNFLQDRLENIKNSSKGTLIFSQFTDVLDLVGVLLSQRGEEYFYMNGLTKNEYRQDMVQRFQKGENHFFLISLKAGGTALTLHRANTIIHLDPWWNPASENQATDRAHRIGQKKKVMVYKLINNNSIEERVIELQKKKSFLFHSLFDDQEYRSFKITHEDLNNILS